MKKTLLLLFCYVLISFSCKKDEEYPIKTVNAFLVNLQRGKFKSALSNVTKKDRVVLRKIDEFAKEIIKKYPEVSKEIKPFEVLPLFYSTLKGKTFKTTLERIIGNKAIVKVTIIPTNKKSQKITNRFILIKVPKTNKWEIKLGLSFNVIKKMQQIVPLSITKLFFSYLKNSELQKAIGYVANRNKDKFLKTISASQPQFKVKLKQRFNKTLTIDPLKDLKKSMIECITSNIEGKTAEVRTVFILEGKHKEYWCKLILENGKWRINPKYKENGRLTFLNL